jgi:hypothetical protein
MSMSQEDIGYRSLFHLILECHVFFNEYIENLICCNLIEHHIEVQSYVIDER